MKSVTRTSCFLVVLVMFVFVFAFTVYAQSGPQKVPVARGPLTIVNEHFSTQTITFDDGTTVEETIINGPPKPPRGYEHERAPVKLPKGSVPSATDPVALSNVPAFKWVFGCSAVSGAMIAGYWDWTGFPNMYAPGGGLNDPIPLSDLEGNWGTWTDSKQDTYPNNPLIASHEGLDGSGLGSIDDYWVYYGSNANDPYIGAGREQHTWGTAIGDYMKTSQSAYQNTDGATSFYGSTSASPLTCAAMVNAGIADKDGTYGRKLFYEARGYKVTDCYSQPTDNAKRGGFSFTQYKAEINAGRPVFLNLQGHSIVGVGYDDATKTVYLHDTWDNYTHSMTWGSSYSGMRLQSVSIVNPSTVTLTDTDLIGSWSNVTWTIKSKGVYTVSGTYTVFNDGAADLANVTANFYLSGDDKPAQTELVQTYLFTNIPGNSSKSASVRFTTKAAPSGKHLIAWIDPGNSVHETNETNNQADYIIP